MCLNSVEQRTQKCDRENRKWWWHQIKPIYMWYLDLVVKRFRQINCLNPWVLIAPLPEIKSYFVLLSFGLRTCI